MKTIKIRIGKKVIAKNVIIRKSVLGQFLGLRFHRKLRNNEAMLFVLPRPSRLSVDMLFVFYPIDLIFLNEKKEVVCLKESLKPFSIFFVRKRCRYLIELPNGSIKKYEIKISDKINL